MKSKKIYKLMILLVLNIRFVLAGEFFEANHPNIQYFGRWDKSIPTAPTHSWPGVYIYTEFTGTSISVRLNDNFCYYNVYIDGEFNSVFHNSESGNVTKILASGLEDTVHTLLFSKRNETAWEKFTFLGFEVDEGKTLLSPKPKPELKIEFIGDSFTSASGNGATTQDTPEHLESFTDIDKGFGPIVARNYGAQYHMTSMSGIGLVLDWQGDYSFNMPDYFDRTLAYNPEPKWDFEQWIPNLVVIGLGLNDYNGYGGYENDIQENETDQYISSYHEFISTIRDYYPGTKILAVAPHVEWIRDCVKKVVQDENNSGSEDIFYAQYSYYNGGYVNNGHPNIDSHAKIAEELISAIDTIDAFSAYIDTIPPVFESYVDTAFISYNTEVKIEVTTDTYTTVKYSLADKSYDEMEYTFDQTGKRKHQTLFTGEHGRNYSLFLTGIDKSGNKTESSIEINFSVDTSKVLLNWTSPQYDANSWQSDTASFGFGTAKTYNSSIAPSHTVYFRKSFQLEDKESLMGLGFLVQAIGGAVVYLNGEEMARFNLPDEDKINYGTPPTSSSYYQKVVTIDQLNGFNYAMNGENLLSVEIHAAETDFSELFFNGQLFNNKNEVIFPFNSDWQFFSEQKKPGDQIIDKSALDIEEKELNLPFKFTLNQNYPNPFNNSTVIEYSISKQSKVKIDIFNLKGQLVENLINDFKNPGFYQFKYTSNLPSGLYFYQLSNEAQTIQRKMLLLK